MTQLTYLYDDLNITHASNLTAVHELYELCKRLYICVTRFKKADDLSEMTNNRSTVVVCIASVLHIAYHEAETVPKFS